MVNQMNMKSIDFRQLYIVFSVFFIIFCLFELSACSDDNVVDTKQSNTNQTQDSETTFNALEDDEYANLNSADLDYLIIKNIPDIFDKYGERFIHNWFRAYDCEYASLVKENKNKFNTYGYDLIADVLADKFDYQDKFIAWGPGSIILSEQYENRGKLSDYVRLNKNGYSGSRIKDNDCPDTKNIYTRHEFVFRRINELDIEIPNEVLDSIKNSSKSVQIKLVIKFTIDKTTIRYFRSNNSYRIKQWAYIDELLLYPYSSNFSQEPFLVLTKSELYN